MNAFGRKQAYWEGHAASLVLRTSLEGERSRAYWRIKRLAWQPGGGGLALWLVSKVSMGMYPTQICEGITVVFHSKTKPFFLHRHKHSSGKALQDYINIWQIQHRIHMVYSSTGTLELNQELNTLINYRRMFHIQNSINICSMWYRVQQCFLKLSGLLSPSQSKNGASGSPIAPVLVQNGAVPSRW